MLWVVGNVESVNVHPNCSTYTVINLAEPVTILVRDGPPGDHSIVQGQKIKVRQVHHLEGLSGYSWILNDGRRCVDCRWNDVSQLSDETASELGVE